MDRNLKFFCCVLLVFATADTYSNEIGNYGDINIQADKITLDEAKNELLLKTNVIISFGIFTITGNKALLSYKNNKLMVDGGLLPQLPLKMEILMGLPNTLLFLLISH